MSDVLSRILAGALGGGAGGAGTAGGGMAGRSPLGEPRLPAEEAGTFGGARRGPAPMQEQGGASGGGPFGGGTVGGGLGRGGLGSGLGDVLGGGGLGGVLGGGGLGGGLGSILGGLLGGGAAGGMPRGGPAAGGLASGLGGMRGIALIALLAYLMRGRGGAAGLSSLTGQLDSAGLGEQVRSWIGTGPNQDVRPEELARAIPPEAMDEIERETGLGRDEVLSELSRGLPRMVDRLTPDGRLPERDEELDAHDEADVLGSLGLGPMGRR